MAGHTCSVDCESRGAVRVPVRGLWPPVQSGRPCRVGTTSASGGLADGRASPDAAHGLVRVPRGSAGKPQPSGRCSSLLLSVLRTASEGARVLRFAGLDAGKQVFVGCRGSCLGSGAYKRLRRAVGWPRCTALALLTPRFGPRWLSRSKDLKGSVGSGNAARCSQRPLAIPRVHDKLAEQTLGAGGEFKLILDGPRGGCLRKGRGLTALGAARGKLPSAAGCPSPCGQSGLGLMLGLVWGVRTDVLPGSPWPRTAPGRSLRGARRLRYRESPRLGCGKEAAGERALQRAGGSLPRLCRRAVPAPPPSLGLGRRVGRGRRGRTPGPRRPLAHDRSAVSPPPLLSSRSCSWLPNLIPPLPRNLPFPASIYSWLVCAGLFLCRRSPWRARGEPLRPLWRGRAPGPGSPLPGAPLHLLPCLSLTRATPDLGFGPDLARASYLE